MVMKIDGWNCLEDWVGQSDAHNLYGTRVRVRRGCE